MRALASLAFLALVLAGCSGGGDPKKDDFEDAFGETPDVAAGKGLIRGIVLNPALVPIPGVLIELNNPKVNQTSDGNGAFVFTDLEPGDYFLQVSKLGYTSVQQSAVVVADETEPDILKVTIDRLESSLPRAETQRQEGFLACSVGTPRTYSSCGFATGAAENPEVWFDVQGLPSFVQTEILWESTQPSGDWLYVIQGFCSCDGGIPDLPPPEDNGSRFDELPDATSPHVARANTTFLREWQVGENPAVGQLAVSISSSGPEPQTTNGSGIALNQGFEVFATFFYNIPEPDPEWTFWEDGPYPVPPVEGP